MNIDEINDHFEIERLMTNMSKRETTKTGICSTKSLQKAHS